MTEQQKYEIPAPPGPSNYKFEQTISWNGEAGPYFEEMMFQYTGKLTCTECGAVLRDSISYDNLDKAVKYNVQRHNSEKHPGLLWVWASDGQWHQLRNLIPDPVKQINDVIGKSAGHLHS